MTKQKITLGVTVILMSLVSIVLVHQIASAACCASQPFYGSTANARKYIYTISSVVWRGDIESAMGTFGEGPAIDLIGWSNWRVYEMCDGTIIDYHDPPVIAASNVSYQARVYQQAFNNCGGVKVAGNRGTHLFQQAGQNTYTPYTDYTQNFP